MTNIVGLGALNLGLALFLGPLFEGFVRKYVRARVAHSRVGPLAGVWQPFIDLGKLFAKENLDVGGGPLQKMSPVICLAATLCAALLVPLGPKPPLEMGGDFIVFIYVIGIGAIAIIVGGMASASPYSYAGATREMMMFIIVEPVMVICLIAAAVNCGSLRFSDMMAWHLARGSSLSMIIAAGALLMALFAQFGKLPFDIPEADQELMGGPFVEMSGPKLALFKWAIWARQFVFAALLVSIFFPWPKVDAMSLQVLLTVVKIFIVFVIVGLVDVVNPRIKIDQALGFYLAVILVALGAVVLAFVAG
jgi:formate hydrogenlyase subunit 4